MKPSLKKWIFRALGGIAVLTLAALIIAAGFFGAKSYKAISRAHAVFAEWQTHPWISAAAPDARLSVHALIAAEDPGFLNRSASRLEFVRDYWAGTTRHQSPITVAAARLLAFKVVEDEAPVDRIYDNFSIQFDFVGESRDRILEIVLNKSFLAIRPDGTEVHGFAEAAEFYFHKPLKDLSAAQTALVASLVASPWRFSPTTHADRALERRNATLAEMARLGFLSSNEVETAQREPLLPRAN